MAADRCASLGIVLGEVQLLLHGLDAELEQRLDERYAPFRATDLDPRDTLLVNVLREELAYEGPSVIVARRACLEAVKKRPH